MPYDYVVVGGGSAGCVLAARLSEDGGSSVALLEAEPPDDLEEILIPARLGLLFKTRITDLATAENVAQPTMTTLVVRLERDGLVERGGDPDDGRAVLVTITDDGLATLRRYGDARAEVLNARLATLSATDREALAAALPALDRLAR